MTTERLAVVVPTFRRPELLRRCLEALAGQEVAPDEIVVARRDADVATTEVVEDFPAVRSAVVSGTGQLRALKAGVRACDATIVAFTDDDAAPHPNWVNGLRRHFADPRVGGVGGRDVVDRPTQTGPLTERVGKLDAWGRGGGNHHLGRGPARDVHVLKGVNMAMRCEALAFPLGLRGGGAEVAWEIASCLWAARRGWRLVYDPSLLVDHTVGPRFDADARERPSASAVADAAYNHLAILLSFRPALGLRRAAFAFGVGDRSAPGIVRTMAAFVRREPEVARRWLPATRGQIEALSAWAQGTRVIMEPATASRSGE